MTVPFRTTSLTFNGGTRSTSPVPTVKSAREAIHDILMEEDGAAEVSPRMIQEVSSALTPSTGWSAAKKSGTSVVPPGEATVALGQLLEDLRSAGLFVVPIGEVESFVREVSGKGPRWVVEVVEQGKLETATEAHGFVKLALAWLLGDSSAE